MLLSFKKKVVEFIRFVTDVFMGSGLMQEELKAEGDRYVMAGMPELIRQVSAESCVLLKNNGVLPLKRENCISVFGRCQFDWFYVGYGSGGDIHAVYETDFIEGLINNNATYNTALSDIYREWTNSPENKADHGWWGHWPFSFPEMPVSEEIVKQAAEKSDTAVVIIGRAAGEDRDNILKPGSYYLTEEEHNLLEKVTSSFEKVVILLNCGSIIDFSWLDKYGERISAVVISWLGGMESGNAVCDVLYGNVNPCGKLPDTIAKSYYDYPSSKNFGGKEYNDYKEGVFLGYRFFDRHRDKMLFPFGYGLSYTSFNVRKIASGHGFARITIKNVGNVPGKEVVRLYCHLPYGKLDKPEKVLVSFKKTEILLPGKSETLLLTFDDRLISSFDEERHVYFLDKGRYGLEVNGQDIGGFSCLKEKILEFCVDISVDETYLRNRIKESMPADLGDFEDKKITFLDVVDRKYSLDRFICTLSDDELEALTRGHGMFNSPLGIPGNAGVYGGITESLRLKKVPVISCCDGPAGLRIQKYCSLLPCGTALAATWDVNLVQKLYKRLAEEMAMQDVDLLLAPGMNLHRNPLCGRNFEYFSEDPVLSGKMASACVNGIQSVEHRGACPKHYICNNQEYKRNINDSRVDERTLRELYLRNFEICIKESDPVALMTSYNKINGVWGHYNYDLVTSVLRKEWGFKGVVMTDWFMKKAKSPEFPEIENNAYRIRAQVDLLMPGNLNVLSKEYKLDTDLLKSMNKADGITKAELQRSVKNVLSSIIRLKYWRTKTHGKLSHR